MRVEGRARLELGDEELELEVAAVDFVFVETWEPSLTVIDVYEGEVVLDGVTLRLVLHDTEDETLSIHVHRACASGAEVVTHQRLARLSPDMSPPAEAIVRRFPARSREARIAAYRATCEAIAAEAYRQAAERPETRDEVIVTAYERVHAVPRPHGASASDIGIRLLYDTGYFGIETLPVPEALGATGIVAVLLRFRDHPRGVYVYEVGVEGRRKRYLQRPADHEIVPASSIGRVVLETQFSTRPTGCGVPTVMYDRKAGGFVLDGPAAQRTAFRATLLAALAEEASTGGA